jgi:phospholipid/cholesterol/gamma-HCH transport system substrate-binding protein
VIVVALLAFGGASKYPIKLALANASGLRPGSQVLLGGVSVGSVKSLDLNRQSVVIANLELNPSDVHVGQGATASIVAANLLGEKYVSLQPGDPHSSLPSGSTLPETATTLPTDLDQVVAVLDDPTRADLATLLREAGATVGGRQRDVSAILRQFPLSLDAATKLLTTLVGDNHTLADLISRSNSFITRVNAQSADLKQVITAADGAATTLALRQNDLRRTVVGLAAPLRNLSILFPKATSALKALNPVAAQIADAAPALDQLLRQVRPFTQAAVPTLNRAADVAPTLSQLAVKATPIIKAAVPTLGSL